MKKEQQLKLKGWFTMRHRDKAGKLLREFTMPNVITNAGKAAVAATIVADVAGNEFDYIAIGTGTNAAAATDTQLQTEIASGGGQRAGAAGTRVTTTVTNDTAQFVVTYNFTSGFAVTESGVLNAASTGDLLCRQVFSAINVANGDSLEVTWKIQVS